LTQLERACLNDSIKLHLRDELIISHGHQQLLQPNPAVVGDRDLPKFDLIGGEENLVSLRTRECSTGIILFRMVVSVHVTTGA
jgi:hypothetical protein